MPPKPLPGPSRLSGILKNLNGSPKPSLPSLKGLTVTLAVKNDDFGAQHFLKDDIPKIRYANQDLNIHINRVPKSADGSHKPEMKLDFKDGKTQDIDMHLKWSTSIFEELMDSAGGDRWQRYKDERNAAGQTPTIPKVKLRNPRVRGVMTPSRSNKRGVAAALP
ncbi:hypothetical protein SCHPADRAFT_846291 [Schizopora paradoxa]|uniref:Ribosomal protein/NADH dehydrogenase domain-containing protein n=1 Tax=Schizopora paradoxa TaxID=27342 RepID=A0A0H2SKC7_9AGAM|nr:hypothetical protein SCHPADRAFT_846291 [Schizopora paradoxa]